MSGPVGDFAEAFRVLFEKPAEAERICRALLERETTPSAQLLLAGALRLQGDFAGALALARPLAQSTPNWPAAHFEAGLALAGLERNADALDAMRRVELLGAFPGVQRAIGDIFWAMGDRARADLAYGRHLAGGGPPEPLLHEATRAFAAQNPVEGERLLRLQLLRAPGDVMAQRILAELYSGQGRFDEAEPLLRACLERAPSFALGRYGLALVLFHQHKSAAAVEQFDLLLERDPRRLEYLRPKAEALARMGAFEESAACLEHLLQQYPNDAEGWDNYGHILRTLGRRDECEAAYKRAIALRPTLGDAYWALANLKTFRFDADLVRSMREQLARPEFSTGDDRIAMLFALGKALEGERDFAGAFAAYDEGNRLRRSYFPHDRAANTENVKRARAVFTAPFFAAHAGSGSAAADPIFIVGMPRAGSTLVEQILSSHSAVEGTMELIELVAIAKRLGADQPYPEMLTQLSAQDLRALGEEYLERTRPFRRTDAPYFIDKLPNNFAHTGLIQLILPNARIVDVRRNPLACCVSNFQQHWATGQTFAYDLTDLGAYYRDYVELMAHFDAVLPGRVHRVIYEKLVADLEGETRRLLDACGLPFEEGCLRFHENKRAVRTPSSEQVRQPIFTAGIDSWKPYDAWLEPLKTALGPTLDLYPIAPPL